METVVGVFNSRSQAGEAAQSLRQSGVSRMSLLTPGDPKEKIETVPTDDMEQPGIGPAIGGLVGGALGIAGGLELGAAAATVLVPGVGPVLAVGLLGAAVLGAGGTAVGVAAGQALEKSIADGLPKDELFIYEDALRLGRTVLAVFSEDEAQARIAHDAIAQAGAESLDAARERWWLGLRPAEEEAYKVHGRPFNQDEESFRKGFEAALHRDLRGRGYVESVGDLRERYGQMSGEFSFRRGFERGHQYYLMLIEKHRG
jgi:hypothetical protein